MNKKTGAIIFALILCLVFVYGYVDTFRLHTSHVMFTDTAFSPSLRGKTLLHLSDLHIGRTGFMENNILKKIGELKPDLIVLTGDYITWNGPADDALSFLSKLSAPLGVYAVMGDYDYSVSRQSCLFCHQPGSGKPSTAHGVRMLKNEATSVRVGGHQLTVAGLDDTDHDSDLTGFFNRLSSGKNPVLVLSHNPLRFDEFTFDAPMLMLAGDTHGGQLPLPTMIWKLLGYEKNARYNSGLYRKGQKTLYVSRGTGTSHVPFRLFCPPEIVVYHFQ